MRHIKQTIAPNERAAAERAAAERAAKVAETFELSPREIELQKTLGAYPPSEASAAGGSTRGADVPRKE